MRAVRGFFIKEVIKNKELSSTGKVLLTAEEEEAEFQKLLDINQKWNDDVALQRNARLVREANEQKQLIFERLERRELQEQERSEAIEAKVRLEKVNETL
jgi:hypothetical protein